MDMAARILDRVRQSPFSVEELALDLIGRGSFERKRGFLSPSVKDRRRMTWN